MLNLVEKFFASFKTTIVLLLVYAFIMAFATVLEKYHGSEAALFAIAITGCKNYDDDIDSLNQRVTSLEAWQNTVNTNISALQTIVNALQTKDYVTGVTTLADGSG